MYNLRKFMNSIIILLNVSQHIWISLIYLLYKILSSLQLITIYYYMSIFVT